MASACTLLDIVCHQWSLIGYGDDPNDAGAVVIAHAFEKAIGRLPPPKSDGQQPHGSDAHVTSRAGFCTVPRTMRERCGSSCAAHRLARQGERSSVVDHR